MLYTITIGADINSESNKQNKQALIAFINGVEVDFIERNKEYPLGNDTVIFKQNLIKTAHDEAGHHKFYIISNEEKDMLGKGSFSKARKISSIIDISSDGTLKYEAIEGKAVRIKNTQAAQSRRPEEVPYQHSEAEEEYQKGKIFTHLGMQAPLEVKKNKPGLGEFVKSYSVMNTIPGADIFDTSSGYINNFEPKLKDILNVVILPLLEAYKTQIAALGHAHRDIKAENILMRMNARVDPPATTVNFIDMDTAVKIGEVPEKSAGSPGFIAPELLLESPDDPVPEATQAGDIFSLGVIALGCFNPDFDINNYFAVCADAINKERLDNDEAIEFQIDLLNTYGSLDPRVLAEQIYSGEEQQEERQRGLFNYLEGPVPPHEAEEIIHLINVMTNKDPAERPDIDQVIKQFKAISMRLEAPLQKEKERRHSSSSEMALQLSSSRQDAIETLRDHHVSFADTNKENVINNSSPRPEKEKVAKKNEREIEKENNSDVPQLRHFKKT